MRIRFKKAVTLQIQPGVELDLDLRRIHQLGGLGSLIEAVQLDVTNTEPLSRHPYFRPLPK